MHRLLALIALSSPAVAFGGYTAGGLELATTNVGELGPTGTLRPRTMPCFGGVGMRVDGKSRLGGEAQFCGNGHGLDTFGGPFVGIQQDMFAGYAFGGAGGGLGWLDAFDDDTRFRAAYLYARPELGAGVPFGWGAVEASLYLMLPLPVIQSIAGDMPPQGSFPGTGLQVRVVFGDLAGRKDRSPEPEVADADPPDPPAPAPPPPPAAPPPPPPEVARAPAPPPRSPPRDPPPPANDGGEGDSRPLAIPANR